MDHNQTQPLNTGQTIQYRCTCGQVLQLDVNEGGVCHDCKRVIAAKVLNHELSRTWAIQDSTHLSPHHDFDVPATPGDEDLIGKSLGHFEIVELLGAGGMGNVYRALDKSLQRYVAVKVLARGSIQGTMIEVDRLLQEAVAQARVNHPNIVSIFYVGKQAGDPFLAMELVPGQTISERMAGEKLSFYEIVFIAWQMTEALKFSHQLDIIHGDIKPSNIMLQSNGVAKLGDFGMARSASSNSLQALGGTPNYLAPELLEGYPASIQSDMYALGVTLYEMSFGHRPVTLSGTSVSEWAKSHRESELTFPRPWPEAIPENWKVILRRLLSRDPKNRYQTYDELSSALLKVAPAQNRPARTLPRFIAAGIDYTLVLIAVGIVQIITFFASDWFSKQLNLEGIGWMSSWDANIPWYVEVLRVLIALGLTSVCFLPIVVYTLAIGYWRQSLGRALMHIRVINQFGLRPTRRILMGRSVLRMAWLWMLISVLNLPLSFFSNYLDAILLIGVTLFTAIEIGYMMFVENGSSLHDRWFKTRVVIDENQQ